MFNYYEPVTGVDIFTFFALSLFPDSQKAWNSAVRAFATLPLVASFEVQMRKIKI